MARIVSFVALVVVLLLIGGLFFEVMAGFLLPLFLALLLVVMFGPMHRWFAAKCGRHERIAALLATGSILLLVLVPMSLLLAEAGREAQNLYRRAMDSPEVIDALATLPTETEPSSSRDISSLVDRGAEELAKLGGRFGFDLKQDELKTNLDHAAREFLAPLALRTTRFLGELFMDLFVMILGVYYFFADGPVMIQTLLRLSPLETGRTRELIDQFDGVTRAVVMATLLSAVVQGLLAGVGFYFAGVGSVFLLTALAMLFALVPFVGTGLIWAPVCLWLFCVEGRATAAVLLAVYCLAVVSMVDNLVKPVVLHGRSNLHPLLALLSVLGGVQALGPIGILVGPMVVAFLQTLLNMVHTELGNITQSPAELRT